MTHDEDVFAALAYRRNVGATPMDIRAYLGFREAPKRTAKDDLKSLRRLEEKGLVVKVAETWFLTPPGYEQARGAALRAQWQSTDAWILASVLYNRKTDDCRLQHILAVADFIEHGIPALAEMHGALNRLLSGHLIKGRKGVTFMPTDAGLELLAKAESTCKNEVREIVDGLRRLLDCPCCGVRLKAVRWRFKLDQATMDQACEDYAQMSRRGPKQPKRIRAK